MDRAYEGGTLMTNEVINAFKEVAEKIKDVKEYVPDFLKEEKNDSSPVKMEDLFKPVSDKKNEKIVDYQGVSEEFYDIGKKTEVGEEIITEESKDADSKDTNENANEEDNSSEKEDMEDKDLTEEEINEKQQQAIKDALVRIMKGEKLTKEELGNLGEMMMDQYYISQGYTPLNKHRVTGLDDKKGGFKTGIDGVYEKKNADGTKSYVIADAKYNTSPLSETNDGKQMSDNWIDKRLDDAVGKEKADEIREAKEDNPDSVSHEVYHINPNMDENGNIHTDIQKVDSEGNKVGEKEIVEYYDEDGKRIEELPELQDE